MLSVPCGARQLWSRPWTLRKRSDYHDLTPNQGRAVGGHPAPRGAKVGALEHRADVPTRPAMEPTKTCRPRREPGRTARVTAMTSNRLTSKLLVTVRPGHSYSSHRSK